MNVSYIYPQNKINCISSLSVILSVALEDESDTTRNTQDAKGWTGDKSVIASRFIFRTPIEHPGVTLKYKI